MPFVIILETTFIFITYLVVCDEEAAVACTRGPTDDDCDWSDVTTPATTEAIVFMSIGVQGFQ